MFWTTSMKSTVFKHATFGTNYVRRELWASFSNAFQRSQSTQIGMFSQLSSSLNLHNFCMDSCPLQIAVQVLSDCIASMFLYCKLVNIGFVSDCVVLRSAVLNFKDTNVVSYLTIHALLPYFQKPP
jgi:hypothetical protein